MGTPDDNDDKPDDNDDKPDDNDDTQKGSPIPMSVALGAGAVVAVGSVAGLVLKQKRAKEAMAARHAEMQDALLEDEEEGYGGNLVQGTAYEQPNTNHF